MNCLNGSSQIFNDEDEGAGERSGAERKKKAEESYEDRHGSFNPL
jgi:hypothetical protein